MNAAEPLIVAVLGAESTGKTRLAQELAAALAHQTGRRATWVPEHLRLWCERQGRTPRRAEQAAIAEAQTRAIADAAAAHALVVCDTTALMTAVYSRIVFGDRSLDASALAAHRACAATLVTALDLPWVADGLQRDGPQVRAPVDAALRELLAGGAVEWSLVAGSGGARLRAALQVLQPVLAREPGQRLR